MSRVVWLAFEFAVAVVMMRQALHTTDGFSQVCFLVAAIAFTLLAARDQRGRS